MGARGSKAARASARFVAVMDNGNGSFVELRPDPARGVTRLICDVRAPGAREGRHGIHVHVCGDLRDADMRNCAHYDPEGTGVHGGPEDPPARRHAGDYGNVYFDHTGACRSTLTLPFVVGPDVLGRLLVIHRDEDDLGRGDAPDSRTKGNSGPHILRGVLGRASV